MVETPNLVAFICIAWRCYLTIFKSRMNSLCTGACKRIRKRYYWICTKLMYGIYFPLCIVIIGNSEHSTFIVLLLENIKLIFYILHVYICIMKYSLIQTCLNVWKQPNVQKVKWRHSRFFKNFLFSCFNKI